MVQRMNCTQSSPHLAFGNLQVVTSLKILPILRRLAKSSSEEQGKFGGDRPSAVYNVRHPHGRNPDCAGEFGLRRAKIFQHLLKKFPGMNRRTVFYFHHYSASVVIDDLDIENITAFESKTNSPLFVDADAPFAFFVASQSFQAIRWWRA